ncbi:MAG: hypothetical protein HYS05_20140 [Acidobacteria bacterium]|nr:hypothetical protein [Acidobacteriota bacterium]
METRLTARIDGVETRLEAKIDYVDRRHMVLIEDLRSQIRLVAEVQVAHGEKLDRVAADVEVLKVLPGQVQDLTVFVKGIAGDVRDLTSFVKRMVEHHE